MELLEKLCCLIPPPRVHRIHFYGVLAPAAKWRAGVVPAQVATQDPSCACPGDADIPRSAGKWRWAALLKRLFDVDTTVCSLCGEKLQIIAAITDPDAIVRIPSH